MKDLYNLANDIANHTTNAEQQRQLAIDKDFIRFNIIYGLLGKLQHGKQPVVTISRDTNKQNIISALENVYLLASIVLAIWQVIDWLNDKYKEYKRER